MGVETMFLRPAAMAAPPSPDDPLSPLDVYLLSDELPATLGSFTPSLSDLLLTSWRQGGGKGGGWLHLKLVKSPMNTHAVFPMQCVAKSGGAGRVFTSLRRKEGKCCYLQNLSAFPPHFPVLCCTAPFGLIPSAPHCLALSHPAPACPIPPHLFTPVCPVLPSPACSAQFHSSGPPLPP